jgi:hypothetical protein
MSLLGSLLPKSLHLKRILFRRDAENAFYSGKPLTLPHLKEITKDNIHEYKNSYPFNLIKGSHNSAEIRDILLSLEDYRQIIQQADLAKGNIFDFPYKENIYLGDRIRWNYDYLSGYEWGKELSWRGEFFRFPDGTDIVNGWLLGRLNQLIYLGKGYLASGDEKYVIHYIKLLNEFIDENPYCTGINWIDPAEVSIRLLNMIFSLPLIIGSAFVDEKFLNIIKNQILHYAVFIENNMEEEDHGYTFLVNIASIAAAGILLKDYDYGRKLIHLASAGGEEAIRKLITSEGISNIRSTAYHPHIVEAFFIIKLSLEKAGMKLSGLFMERYSKMFDVLSSYLREDNSVPIIGDNFIRRILPFSNETNNFPLAVGCIEFNKGVYKSFFPSPIPELLFLKGKEAVEEFRRVALSEYKKISYGYLKSGIFILRNEDIHIAVDAADIGSGRRKTTGHNDILSFELFFKGKPVIVDPGTYSLYSDPAIRKQQRSVKNHNSLFIDDEEPVVLEGIQNIKEDLTKPKVTEWHSDEYEDILSVQHYAYARFADPVIIKRIFRFRKEKNKLILRDELFGGSSHKCTLNFILHPDIDVRQTALHRFSFSGPAEGELIFSTPEDVYSCSLHDSLYSPSYGKVMITKKITIIFTSRLPVYSETEILLK